IAIRFAKDFDLISVVKKIPGARFSKTNTCWYVVNEGEVLKAILERLKDKAVVDYSNIETHPAKKFLPLKECPIEYIEQLDRMRYSLNTKKVYINFFTRFLNYFSATSVDEISDDQVNEYMRHLLLTRKVASSTQNQVINAIKFYYEKVRKNERKVYALERPLKETKLPKVLSEEEVIAITKVGR
ncbi:MAG: site-specific integrase, partial [Cyclobacteriaceae bacterium]